MRITLLLSGGTCPQEPSSSYAYDSKSDEGWHLLPFLYLSIFFSIFYLSQNQVYL